MRLIVALTLVVFWSTAQSMTGNEVLKHCTKRTLGPKKALCHGYVSGVLDSMAWTDPEMRWGAVPQNFDRLIKYLQEHPNERDLPLVITAPKAFSAD